MAKTLNLGLPKKAVVQLIVAVPLIILAGILLFGYAALGIGAYNTLSKYPTLIIIILALIVGAFIVRRFR